MTRRSKQPPAEDLPDNDESEAVGPDGDEPSGPQFAPRRVRLEESDCVDVPDEPPPGWGEG